jgi:hypothetical protein
LENGRGTVEGGESMNEDAKEDFYREEDWIEKGDAFGEARPRLDHMYRCEGCGSHVQVKADLWSDRERKERKELIVECVAECLTCSQIFLVLVNRNLLWGGK